MKAILAIVIAVAIVGWISFAKMFGLEVRIPAMRKCDAAVFFAMCLACAVVAQKGTNDPPRGASAPCSEVAPGNGEDTIATSNGVSRCSGGVSPSRGGTGGAVTIEDVDRMFSVVSVGTNEVFDFTMPAGATRVREWWLRGGSNDSAFVPGGVSLIGGELLDSLRNPKVAFYPLKATSLLVAGESEFWHQQTASNSMVYTWKDAYLWRNLSLPFSMQTEIFDNGDFEYRYDLSRISDMDAFTNVVIGAKFGTNELGDVSWLLDGTNTVTSIRMHRLSEFDWDGDGLANPIDPDPYTNGGDCHGTCVEWYNASCSNVLSATANTTGEIEISWNTNANQTAYYWLDLTVTGQTGVAMVTITCDGPSNLGDMMVVALTNQVCRVPMLAGATYAIYSTLPLGSVSASSQYAVVELCPATSATVSLPLAFSFAYVGPGGMPTANYVLQTSPMNVGAALASVLGTCCSCQTAGAGFSWVCSAACSCAGQTGHAIPSVATWEGYSYSFLDNAMCPCYYVEQEAVQQIATLGPSLDILDSLGNAISWKDPVLVGEDVQIEVVLQGNGMSVAEFVSLFGGRLRLKSWWVDSEGSHDISSVAVPVSVSTVVALSPTAFRVAVPASWLVANGLVRNGSDAIQSKTSIDMSASATGDSNRQDSDHVDANAPGRLHGRARGREQGNSVAAIPEGAFNLKTVRAAGTACLAATAGYVESDKKQCQQQADLVYYSGHGHHDTGDINGIATPEQVSGWWHDVDAVVLAGCAVLDIGDKGNNYADSPSSHAASPGLKWLSASGASVLLGYAYYAPLDDKGGMEIVERWCAQRASLGDVEAWMKANDCRSGHNACAIRQIDATRFEYYYFHRSVHSLPGFDYNTYLLTNVVEEIQR